MKKNILFLLTIACSFTAQSTYSGYVYPGDKPNPRIEELKEASKYALNATGALVGTSIGAYTAGKWGLKNTRVEWHHGTITRLPNKTKATLGITCCALALNGLITSAQFAHWFNVYPCFFTTVKNYINKN